MILGRAQVPRILLRLVPVGEPGSLAGVEVEGYERPDCYKPPFHPAIRPSEILHTVRAILLAAIVLHYRPYKSR